MKRDYTLCILTRNNPELEVLLAMKKYGFGVGKWNGVGGKFDPGETAEQAAIREAKEEIGITMTDFQKVAEFEFIFTDKPEMHEIVHVYLVTGWTGEPVETEEMAPQWFKPDTIPYSQMWADDKIWLPRILAGEKLKGRFVFEGEEIIGEPLIENLIP